MRREESQDPPNPPPSSCLRREEVKGADGEVGESSSLPLSPVFALDHVNAAGLDPKLVLEMP